MYAFDSAFGKQTKNYNLSEIATKSGFKFRDIVNRKLDWKTLGCVDVNKIVDNQDYEFLERIVPKLIEAPMQSILSTAALDPAVSSLFRLAQLSLQYLSFCQQFMDHTLFDLRTAFNRSQKKYSNLKHHYKLLEEQHYKAQERIQQLLSELNGNNDIRSIKQTESIVESHVKTKSLFPCDQCTKNFLTADSLRSHQQRKHSTFQEKHELSDDNEKEKNSPKEKNIVLVSPKPNTPVEKELEQHINDSERGTKQDERAIDNNNDVPKKSCTECSKKSKVSSSSVAVQCEGENVPEIETDKQDTMQSETNKTQIKDTETAIHAKDSATCAEHQNKQEAVLVQTAYDTINELKQEILELRNSLNRKQIAETTKEKSQEIVFNDSKLDETNDKIEFIAQKFDAFETMYTQSQNQFIESFRNLDERQKDYISNIQETVKEIVEESIGKYSAPSLSKKIEVRETIEESRNETVKEVRVGSDDSVIDKNAKECVERGNANEIKNGIVPLKRTTQPVKIQETRNSNESDSDWSSECEKKHEKMICQADIHTVDNSESDESSLKPTLKNVKKKSKKIITKEMAKNKFEQRLRQLGVDVDSVGLSTPRSQEITEELADEREEMKKAFKSFKTTRHKLENEVDRIAKARLNSANSVTSLSSASHISDEDQLEKGLEDEEPKTLKLRPKSANIQKIRKRNAKKLVKKYVENDIDESDIMDKMEMAQKAINAHRECIQELLQTTAHAPNKIMRIKYPAGAATTSHDVGEKPLINGTTNDNNSNQYNKMPNVTTRRVVFVNLDEDS